MEDIVGIKVEDKEKGIVGFMTWGRVFHRTDPTELEQAIASSGLEAFGLTQVMAVQVCSSLQEVAGFQYFFEGLIAMTQKPIPHGKAPRVKWAAKIRRQIAIGKELVFLGGPQSAVTRKKLSITKGGKKN